MHKLNDYRIHASNSEQNYLVPKFCESDSISSPGNILKGLLACIAGIADQGSHFASYAISSSVPLLG